MHKVDYLSTLHTFSPIICKYKWFVDDTVSSNWVLIDIKPGDIKQ